MVVGDVARFAIEVSVQAKQGSRLAGRLHYWLSHETIGDPEAICDLNTVVNGLHQLSLGKGRRHDEALALMDAKEAFFAINRHLYVDFGQTDSEAKADWYRYQRFIAKPPGTDLFDDWKCFLIENGRRGRFLWANLCESRSLSVSERILAVGEFDSVLIAFVRAMRDAFPGCIKLG